MSNKVQKGRKGQERQEKVKSDTFGIFFRLNCSLSIHPNSSLIDLEKEAAVCDQCKLIIHIIHWVTLEIHAHQGEFFKGAIACFAKILRKLLFNVLDLRKNKNAPISKMYL